MHIDDHKRTSLQLKLPTTANGRGDIADLKPSHVLTSKLDETPVCVREFELFFARLEQLKQQ
ncbi:MAG TPA: hypothetical protein VLR92_05090 [Blastocatellia bacterium]|nr:hypothetical protein [Blastocatellia bacterium]